MRAVLVWPRGVSKLAPQVPLIADLLDEPNDDRSINMLDALPQNVADYYSDENNVVQWLILLLVCGRLLFGAHTRGDLPAVAMAVHRSGCVLPHEAAEVQPDRPVDA